MAFLSACPCASVFLHPKRRAMNIEGQPVLFSSVAYDRGSALFAAMRIWYDTLCPPNSCLTSRISSKTCSSLCRARLQAFRARNALSVRAGRSDCRPGVSFRKACSRRRRKERSRISHKRPCHAGDILAGTLLRACAVAHVYPIRRAALPRNLLSLTARGPSVVANPFAVRSVRKIKDG